jgi:hypothetical protein
VRLTLTGASYATGNLRDVVPINNEPITNYNITIVDTSTFIIKSVAAIIILSPLYNHHASNGFYPTFARSEINLYSLFLKI